MVPVISLHQRTVTLGVKNGGGFMAIRKPSPKVQGAYTLRLDFSVWAGGTLPIQAA